MGAEGIHGHGNRRDGGHGKGKRKTPFGAFPALRFLLHFFS